MLMPSDADMCRRIHQSFLSRAKWKLKFVWWPKRCVFSNQWIWSKLAYCGVARWMGPGSDAVEVEWATTEEYLVARLKGII
jgi:hypothetical protein